MASDAALKQWHSFCEYCDAVKTFRGDYEHVVQNDNGFWIHTLLVCSTCDAPIFVVQEPYPDGDLSEPSQLYPSARGARLHGAPKAVRSAFREAVSCLERASAPTAAAVMCRRTLEVLCFEHDATGRDLKVKLEALRTSGIIDANLLEWATELRFLGNEAAHGIGEVDRQDAKDAVEFTEAMLSYVYTYRQSFDLFKRRRAETKEAAAAKKAVKTVTKAKKVAKAKKAT